MQIDWNARWTGPVAPLQVGDKQVGRIHPGSPLCVVGAEGPTVWAVLPKLAQVFGLPAEHVEELPDEAEQPDSPSGATGGPQNVAELVELLCARSDAAEAIQQWAGRNPAAAMALVQAALAHAQQAG